MGEFRRHVRLAEDVHRPFRVGAFEEKFRQRARSHAVARVGLVQGLAHAKRAVAAAVPHEEPHGRTQELSLLCCHTLQLPNHLTT